MGNSRASIITLRTRRRPAWMWWLIGWARRLHRLTGELVAYLER